MLAGSHNFPGAPIICWLPVVACRQAPWVEPAEPAGGVAVAGQPGIPRSHLEDLGRLPSPPYPRRTDL